MLYIELCERKGLKISALMKTRKNAKYTVSAASGEPSKAERTSSLFKKASYNCRCTIEAKHYKIR